MRCAVFPPCAPPGAPNGILVKRGRDKRETNCALGPMPRSHFSFNLHQALFWGQSNNSISHPWRGIFTLFLGVGKLTVSWQKSIIR